MIASILCALFAYCAEPSVSVSRETPSVEATMEIAVPTVMKWEGVKTTAYLDTIAVPPVWTICYGETEGVQRGDTRTMAECAAGLREGLLRYRAGLHGYLTPETIDTRLNPSRDASLVSFAWNVGIAGAGGSTAIRRLNNGDIRGCCEAMTWWNKAGKRVIRGLVNRRAYEKELCMVGVS